MSEKTIEELRKQAEEKAAEGGADKTVDNITFKKGSGTEAVFKALERAKAPLARKVVIERAAKYGEGHKESRMETVLGYFLSKKIAVKNEEGLISLATRKVVDPESESAEEDVETESPEANNADESVDSTDDDSDARSIEEVVEANEEEAEEVAA